MDLFDFQDSQVYIVSKTLFQKQKRESNQPHYSNALDKTQEPFIHRLLEITLKSDVIRAVLMCWCLTVFRQLGSPQTPSFSDLFLDSVMGLFLFLLPENLRPHLCPHRSAGESKGQGFPTSISTETQTIPFSHSKCPQSKGATDLCNFLCKISEIHSLFHFLVLFLAGLYSTLGLLFSFTPHLSYLEFHVTL